MFADRREAGKELAKELAAYRDEENTIVLGLPRGGVPVAFEVARALNLPLDIMLVRKLGVPGFEELAMGAIADGGVQILNQETIAGLGIAPHRIDDVIAKENAELQRRGKLYRGNRKPPDLRGMTVILVDDGVATGSGMRAAIRAAREQGAKCVAVAVPTAPEDVYEMFSDIADEVVCCHMPEVFFGVGDMYRDFSQTRDKEVIELLNTAFIKPRAAMGRHRDGEKSGQPFS
jgi:predicted phosphoribosyltransferase